MTVGARGALATIAGVILSGPLAVGLVEVVHPQPAWSGARAFADSYHPIQLLPYVGGILLVGGLVVLMAGIHAAAPARRRESTGAVR